MAPDRDPQSPTAANHHLPQKCGISNADVECRFKQINPIKTQIYNNKRSTNRSLKKQLSRTMANNGGRQGGGGAANGTMNDHIEFTVKVSQF